MHRRPHGTTAPPVRRQPPERARPPATSGQHQPPAATRDGVGALGGPFLCLCVVDCSPSYWWYDVDKIVSKICGMMAAVELVLLGGAPAISRHGMGGTTTWFERKPVFFKHFKRPKFFILGKFCTHPPGDQGSRAHLIWAIN
jgi:hypothetical protein